MNYEFRSAGRSSDCQIWWDCVDRIHILFGVDSYSANVYEPGAVTKTAILKKLFYN